MKGRIIMNMFDFFENNEELMKFEEEQKALAKKLAEENPKTSKTAKNNNPVNKTETKIEGKTKIPKRKSEEELLIEAIKGSNKIVCKVFALPAFEIDNLEEIKEMTIERLLELLIINGFEEFATFKPEFRFTLKEEDKTIIVLPLYPDMKSKG